MLKAKGASGSASEWRFDFTGRNRRPPLDPVNCMLSYAYSLLAKDLAVACLIVGFDPFMGLYHRPRYGRPALALDLMEEFRPIVADSVALWAANNGVVSPGDFVRRGPAVAFRPAGRRKFIEAYEKRLDALVTHPVFGYRLSYRRVLEVQARLLGRVLLGELREYPAFRTR
jgi:CRISPR-associated protein Cas1